jgi:trehalose 6-phosphate phosphatase
VSRACFLGDDVGDLDAFDALDRLEASGGQGLRVAVGSSELPDALRDRADLVLRDPGEAAEFLAELAAATAR